MSKIGLKSFAACTLVCLLMTGTSYGRPSFNKSDIYAGCVFGNAIPLMHQGIDETKANAEAQEMCAGKAVGIEGDELEGLSDYINLVLDKVNELKGKK